MLLGAMLPLGTISPDTWCAFAATPVGGTISPDAPLMLRLNKFASLLVTLRTLLESIVPIWECAAAFPIFKTFRSLETDVMNLFLLIAIARWFASVADIGGACEDEDPTCVALKTSTPPSLSKPRALLLPRGGAVRTGPAKLGGGG